MSVQVSTPSGPYGLPTFRAVCCGCGRTGPAVEGRPLRRGRPGLPDLQDPAFELARTISGFRETLQAVSRRRWESRLYCSECVCSKCKRGPATACQHCKAILCDDCGDQHDPPDCPPLWKEYLRASLGLPDQTDGGEDVHVQESR